MIYTPQPFEGEQAETAPPNPGAAARPPEPGEIAADVSLARSLIAAGRAEGESFTDVTVRLRRYVRFLVPPAESYAETLGPVGNRGVMNTVRNALEAVNRRPRADDSPADLLRTLAETVEVLARYAAAGARRSALGRTDPQRVGGPRRVR